MDIDMPYLSGMETSARIRATKYTGLIFGIAGNLTMGAGVLLGAGFNEILMKPVSVKSVLDAFLKHGIVEQRQCEIFQTGSSLEISPSEDLGVQKSKSLVFQVNKMISTVTGFSNESGMSKKSIKEDHSNISLSSSFEKNLHDPSNSRKVSITLDGRKSTSTVVSNLNTRHRSATLPSSSTSKRMSISNQANLTWTSPIAASVPNVVNKKTKGSILLIDDSKISSNIFTRLMESLNPTMKISVLTNREDYTKAFEDSEAYDLVFVDQESTASKLREVGYLGKIILLVANGSLTQKHTKLGVNDVLLKPIIPAKLSEILEKHMKK
ncbi:hypothetical protein HK098_002531 [Nowakowskiella sp. JEL0407]|nr:hypothetical protein HK098_002531 [Nowakowskiella sp. JEL0407]